MKSKHSVKHQKTPHPVKGQAFPKGTQPKMMVGKEPMPTKQKPGKMKGRRG